MRVGVVFPQVEIEPDPGAIRAYAEAVTALGYSHILVYDHVLGVDTRVWTDWGARARAGGATSAKPYDLDDRFHEPMVLFGFLAAVTPLELVSGVLVLPQRQAQLVAKQAAQVDVLTGGRLRLGVGIGWSPVEYGAMGAEFRTRGRRIDEQILLLRRLWTETSVDFDGADHTLRGVGLAPRPVQRPIPIWIGAGPDHRALDRVGRLGDGWLPVGTDPRTLHDQWAAIRAAASQAGRTEPGIEGRIEAVSDPDRVATELAAWRDLGATHVALNTMRAGHTGVEAHIQALRRAAAALG
jgi:probable F420-dependent oxidoreductase